MEKWRAPAFLLLTSLLLCCGTGLAEVKISSYWERAKTLLKVVGDGCPGEIAVATLRKACEDLDSPVCQSVVDVSWNVYNFFGGGAGWGVDFLCQTIGEAVYPYVKGAIQLGVRVVNRVYTAAYDLIANLFSEIRLLT